MVDLSDKMIAFEINRVARQFLPLISGETLDVLDRSCPHLVDNDMRRIYSALSKLVETNRSITMEEVVGYSYLNWPSVNFDCFDELSDIADVLELIESVCQKPVFIISLRAYVSDNTDAILLKLSH